MKREERIKVVKAMELLARQVNDCDVFNFWLSLGVADGDIEYGDLESPEINGIQDDAGYDLDMYYEDDNAFSDLLDTFLVLMVKAYRSGGLYCDGVWSEVLKHGRRSAMTNADRIRAMTDEELAHALMCQPGQRHEELPCTEADCIKCTLDWLKQEVSDNG